jgi:ABC transporter
LRKPANSLAQRTRFGAAFLSMVSTDERGACRGGGTIKDIYLEQINVSNAGKNLIEDSELMLAHGRRYGVVGRNGTGKTTFLRALVSGEVKGLPKHAQVLHVEQEVVGDDTSVLEARAPLLDLPCRLCHECLLMMVSCFPSAAYLCRRAYRVCSRLVERVVVACRRCWSATSSGMR